jgi:predicted metal-dependent phosphoesterase TrpH
MFKVDLHTHSIGSPDGSLRAADYRRMLERGGLDYIAVTDHNSIAFASELQKSLGEKIIVGEEIMAREGEIVGLYLREVVPAGLSAVEAVAKIHEQGGIAYAPHPFSNNPKGLPRETLDALADQIDIVETCNGRAIFQANNKQASAWAETHGKPAAASSDAHGRAGWGKTYSIVSEKPTPENLVELLKSSTYSQNFIGLRGALYPKFNRLKRKFGHA